MKPLSAETLHRLVLHAVGVLLMFAGIALVALTAHSVMNYRLIAGRHGGETMDLGSDAALQAGQHGRMARIVATPSVIEAPTDPEFNLRVSTPVLIRHVEMFQWREVRLGGDISYELDWVDHPLDSSHFKQPGGHMNPASFPLPEKRFDAGLIQMGGFKLAPKLLRALPGFAPVQPDTKALPANLAASFSPYNRYLVTSAQPGNPRLGDVRVSWEDVPLQEMTIFARVDGNQLVPAIDAPDGKGYDIEVGNVALIDMLPDLPMPPEYLFLKRALALLLATLGAFVLLLARERRRDVLLAAGLGMMSVGAVSTVLWLGNDAGVMAAWLAVTAIGIGLSVWRLRRPTRSPSAGG